MKVYVATSGSYFDYSVVAVCARREDALLLGDGDPLEMDLVEKTPQRVTVYSMTRDALPPEISYETWDVVTDVGKRPKVETWKRFDGRTGLTVNGTDQMAVRKVFSDRLAQLSQEGE